MYSMQAILYGIMLTFGKMLEVEPRKAPADRLSRDTLSSYKRRKIKNEISGVVQLVKYWKAIGHTNVVRCRQQPPQLTVTDALQETQGGPSRDIIRNVWNLNAATELLDKLSIIGQRIDDMYKQIDPKQHEFLVNVKEKLENKYATFKMLSALDPTIFHGRSLIYNRETQEHTDSRDPKSVLTPILTFGGYYWGTLHIPQLGLDVDYGPRTLVMLRGGELAHGVSYGGGQRISIAHFLHAYTLKELGLEGPPLNSTVPPDGWNDVTTDPGHDSSSDEEGNEEEGVSSAA